MHRNVGLKDILSGKYGEDARLIYA